MKRALSGSCRCFCALVLLLACTLPSHAKTQDKKTDADYIGADACQSCHDDSYATFAASPHKALLDRKPAAQRGCEACHGPGAVHANSNGDVSRIFRFADAKPVEIRSRCGACHQPENQESHLREQVSCLVCHAAHHYSQKQFLLIKPAAQ
jgi:hypothetical protein